MNVIRRRAWDLPERLATPEHLVFSRRKFLIAGASAMALTPSAAGAQRVSDVAALSDPTADLYPAKRNETYKLDRPITDEKINDNYNNFYEFGSRQAARRAAQKLPIRPWTVKIDGLVEKPIEIGIDELIRKMTLEERTYRHRCVEAWCMAIAWTGFPLARLVDFAKPLGSAKYRADADILRSQDRARPAPDLVPLALCRRPHHGRGDQRSRLPRHRRLWPADGQAAWRAVATGGAVEIRLQVDQVDRALHLHRRAAEELLGGAAGREYGFWANVNPQVPHPRWSQASEEVIGTGDRKPTLLFNGYGEFVAGLYKGLESERLWA